jgi:hypothetical protein
MFRLRYPEIKTNPQEILNHLDTIDCEVKHDYGYISAILSGTYATRLRYVSECSKLDQEIQKRWPDYWEEFRGLVLHSVVVLQPCWRNLSMISYLRQNGTNSNTTYGSEVALLKRMLWDLGKWKERDGERPLPDAMANMVLLIMLGAEIHAIEPCSFDRAESWSELISHCENAMEMWLFHDWRLALEWSRLDPDHVFLEDQRRRKQAFRLRGATRSGVDETVLDSPSIDGLRCRRCSRRYCNNHDLSMFKDIQAYPMSWTPEPEEVSQAWEAK